MEVGLGMDAYYGEIIKIIEEIRSTERENILRAARIVADQVKNDKLVYVFGKACGDIVHILFTRDTAANGCDTENLFYLFVCEVDICIVGRGKTKRRLSVIEIKFTLNAF